MKNTLLQKLPNIKLANISAATMNWLRKGAFHAFELTIIFVLISIVLGLVVYLRYKSLEPAEFILPQAKTLRFQQDLYNEILKKIEERQEKFQRAEGETYLDPFYPRGLTGGEE